MSHEYSRKILKSLINVADNLETEERFAERCNREKIPQERFRDAVAEYIGREE